MQPRDDAQAGKEHITTRMSQDPRYRPDFGAGAGHGEPALDTAGPRRDTVGRILRRAREREGLDIADVAEALRIRSDYLQAIERSEFERLPGATYAIGFVRSYAGFLELDDEEIVRRFKQEVAGLNRTQDLSFPEPVNEGKVPGRALLIVSVLLIAAAYGGWSYVSTSGAPIRDMVPAVPERLQAFLENSEGTATGSGASVDDFAASAGDTGGASAGPAAETEVAGATESAPETATGPQPEPAGGDAESGRSEARDGAQNAAEPSADGPRSPETGGGAADATATADVRSASDAPAASGDDGGGDGAGADPPATAGSAGEGAAGDAGTAATAEVAPPPSTAPAGGATGGSDGDTVGTETGGAPATHTAAAPAAPDTDGGRAPADARGSSDAPAAPQSAGGVSDTSSEARATPPDGSGVGAADGGGAGAGIPEAPDTDGAATQTGAAGAGTQTAALPEPPADDNADAATAESATGGAQAELLAQAERVFGEGNADSRLILRATQDSWVQVRGPEDSLLMTRVLNPGDVYRVPNRDGLVLHTGNAGGLRVYLDGNPLRRLGETGEVRRNVALSPEKLR